MSHFRWTIKDIKEMSDEEILRGLINERISDLNPYAPLFRKLTAIRTELDKKVTEGDTRHTDIVGWA